MSNRLTEEQQQLLDEARKIDGSAVANALLFERDREAEAAYVIPAPCSNGCGTEVMVNPEYRKAARCSTCIAAGRPPGGPVLSGEREPTITYERLRSPYVPEEAAPPAKRLQPLVTTRDPAPGGYVLPSAVAKLQRHAEGLGWTVNAHYSKDTPPGWHPPRALREHVSLRMSRGGYRAVAVHDGTSWNSMWGIRHMIGLRTMGELKEYLALAVEDMDAWVRRLHAKHHESDVSKSETAPCPNARVHPAHGWTNKNGALKSCKGRDKDKIVKQKENGG